MSRHYDHVNKIEELNYKEGWQRGVMHVFGSCTPSLWYYIEDSYKTLFL
jgi:hypothetical protein